MFGIKYLDLRRKDSTNYRIFLYSMLTYSVVASLACLAFSYYD